MVAKFCCQPHNTFARFYCQDFFVILLPKSIPGNQKHLSQEDRHLIEEPLNNGISFKHIARYLCSYFQELHFSHLSTSQRQVKSGSESCKTAKTVLLHNTQQKNSGRNQGPALADQGLPVSAYNRRKEAFFIQ